MRKELSVDALYEGVVGGDRAVIARVLTLVESSREDHRRTAAELLTRLAPLTGRARRVGISGVPGAGKSTFTNALGVKLIEAGHRIGVLAVDPSSTRTGGSILGDRTRMADLAASDDAYIRPSPSGGHLGGVARATREAMLVLEAAGFDTLLIETVGVGQSEVAVAGMVDTFLMLALARAGDQLQGIKRGILELTDVIAVNKADGEHAGEARVTARELSIAMKLMRAESTEDDRVPVLTCSAMTGDGLMDVWAAVVAHGDRLREQGALDERRRRQQLQWMDALVEEGLRRMVLDDPELAALRRELQQRVGSGTLSALDGAQDLLEAVRPRG